MRLQELQAKYQIDFKKSLGQNLLLDENINRIMVDAAALTSEDDVIEVGAGLGALTKRLHELAGRVLAVEIDRTFMPCLEDQFGAIENVTIFRGDILNHELEKLVDEFLPNPRRLKLVSNLPYYITTPILFQFWESSLQFDRLVVMVQEEVAERLVAPVGAKNYGKLTLAANYYSEVDIVHRVPRTCFVPKPQVDSCIVRMRNRENSLFPDVSGHELFEVIGAAFGQRRKTIRNAMSRSTLLGKPIEAIDAALDASGIEPTRRGQTLSLEEFATLTRHLYESA